MHPYTYVMEFGIDQCQSEVKYKLSPKQQQQQQDSWKSLISDALSLVSCHVTMIAGIYSFKAATVEGARDLALPGKMKKTATAC